MMEGQKCISRELLKAIFCHLKKPKQNKKADIFLKLAWSFFSEICMKCLNPQVRISKMVNENTVDYHPNPSELTSRIHPFIFLWIFLEFFLRPVFRAMVAEKFQIHDVKITGKCICESKSWTCSFLIMSLSKNRPQVLIITTSGRRKVTISLKQRFLYFSSAEREEDYGAEKMAKITLARVLVASFDKFCHFCNHYIFGFCSVAP